MAPKAEPEKEKKEKKEKKEEKEDKEKKEKKEKKEEKEKKEKKDKEDDGKKKPRKLADGGGFNAWESVGEATTDYTNTKKPQDKREIAAEKDKNIKKNNADAGLVKASDVVQEEMRKMNEAKKKEREEKQKEEKRKEKEAKTAREAEAEQKEEFEIMDNSGAGNFMAKHEVMDIMKNTVAEASSSSSSRCQISPSTKMGDTAFLGKKTIFTALGDFACVKGFVFIRGPKDEQGFNLKLTRPSVVYICHSERPDENDAWLTSWKDLKEDFSLPELDDSAASIVVGKRKEYKNPESKNVSIPKAPPGIDCVLCFVQPDFHAKPFPSDEDLMTEEELLEKKRQDAANARGSKATTSSTSEKKKEDADEQLEKVLKKVDAGEKLSNKEQRLYEKYKEKNKVWTNEEDEFAKEKGLNSFSISLPGGKNDPPAAGDAFTCDGFTITAPKQTLFDNASITIAQGKRYGILGPNGMGKTTILRHLHQREMPIPLNWDVILVEQEAKASNNTAVQEVIAADERVAELLVREAELIKKLEEIEENANTGEGEQWEAKDFEKAREELSDIAAEMEARGADSAEARVRKILCGLGFTNGKPDEDRFSMDRPVIEFSGGWRMRISLAKALFLEPKLLMLDEPTNHLDLDAVLWLDHYLSEVYPHAVIVVSHDADFLDSICTDIYHLENKKLIHYRGNYNQFKIMHQQKRDTLDKEYKKQQDMLRDLKKKGKTQDEAIAQVKARFNINSLDDLMAKTKDYVVKFTFHGHGKDQSIGGVNVSEVAFSYNGKEPWLLDEVEIGVDCASRIAVVGPNGMGKSTLLNLMMEHLEPCKGEVTIAKGLRVKQYHQHFEELLPLDKDPTEYLINAFDLSPPERARAVLGQFGLPGASHFTKIGNLSGGQKARVAFSALMLMKPHIMILDEPTNHLDIESVEALTDAIKQFNGGLVLVTHDARLITAIDCDIWVVEHGECYKFEKGFDGYRDHVLEALEERQAEVERMEQRRREAKEKERAKHVDQKKMEEAKKKRAEEEKKKKASEEESAKETTKEKKAVKEEKAPEEAEEVMDFGEKKKKKEKKEKNEEEEEVMDFGEKKKKKDKKEKKDDEEKKAPDTPEKKAPEAPAPEKPAPSKSEGGSKAALRAELEEMKSGALRKKAKASGVSEDDLEEADDADDPKQAFIALILGTVEEDEEEEAAEGDSGEAALRAELEEMKKGALRKRAVAAGVDETELEEADDEDDKQAYVELIVKYECKSSPASKDDSKKKAEAEKKEKEKEAEAKKKAEAEAAKKKEEEAKKKAEEAKKESSSEEEDEDDDDDAVALALLKKQQQAKKKVVEVPSDPEEEQLPVQPKEDVFSDDDKKKKKKGAAVKAKSKPKAKAKEEKKPWEQSDDEDEEAQGEEDDEDDGVDHAETNFGAKGTNKKNAPKAKAKGKDKKKKGDASDDDDAPAPKAKSKGGKKKNDDDDDDDAPAPKAKGKAGKKKGDVSDDDDAPAPKAKGKAGKKNDDDDDEDAEADPKAKMTAKSKRAAADAAKKAAAAEERRKREEAAKLEEEEEAAAGNRKKDKGKKGDKSESKADADEEEAPKSQKKGASAKGEADGGNDEASDLIVSGVVASCEPLRKKGNFLVMVTVGDREVQIIDSAEHDAGKKVKVALEGATLPNGKTVKREKIGGEFSEGALIK